MNEQGNPLRSYFRIPALHLRLPSGGQHWPVGSIDLPPTGTVPVLPMTAVDEITYRTPDSLFNGSAVISVIQSCCPCIHNAWLAPSQDITALLMAIRLASYGSSLQIASVCPSCAHTNDFNLDLQENMGNLKSPNFNDPLQLGDLLVYFRPISYKQQNQFNMRQYEQQRTIAQITESTTLTEDQKRQALTDALNTVTELTLEVLCAGISAIRTPTESVTELQWIQEFVKNTDRKNFDALRARAVSIREQSELPPLQAQCSECKHQYLQTVLLDASNFFEFAS